MENKNVVNEIHACECGHGRARHSDKPAGNPSRLGEYGYLCLIPECPCFQFRAAKIDERAA